MTTTPEEPAGGLSDGDMTSGQTSAESMARDPLAGADADGTDGTTTGGDADGTDGTDGGDAAGTDGGDVDGTDGGDADGTDGTDGTAP